MAQTVRRVLFVIGILLVAVWWYDDGGWEPLSVLVLTLASLTGVETYQRRRQTDSLETKKPKEAEDVALGLVERSWLRATVQAPGAATRNELSILLLKLYPKWATILYIRRSIRSATQPLSAALNELLEMRHVVCVLGFFYKLTELGVREAEIVVKRYATGYGNRTH